MAATPGAQSGIALTGSLPDETHGNEHPGV
jgi:hypothetical protein